MEIRSSRRQFLQTGAGAVGAAFAVRTIRLNAEPLGDSRQPVPASDRVRFGMIGVGMQGSGLLARSVALPGVECAAAADLYDGRHARAREIAGSTLRTTRRYQDLLNDKTIDCIVAAVPDHWHKQVVIDAVSAGKDIYCEKPMSHSVADGHAMVAAAQKSGRIVQIGAQRTSSVLCAKARDLVSKGILGDLQLVEGSLGRNDPTGAWVYPPPPDLSPATLDWDTWQGDVPKRAFDPNIFARWRCWKEYGTGVAGDLMVHLISGMLFTLGLNEAPRRVTALGGIRRFNDGRNMPDVHMSLDQVQEHAGLHPVESWVREPGGPPLLRLARHPRALGKRPVVRQPARRRSRSQLLRGELSGESARRVPRSHGTPSTIRSQAKNRCTTASTTWATRTTTRARISGSTSRP